MAVKNQLFNPWLDSLISFDRDILKLSSASILAVGTLSKFYKSDIHWCLAAIYLLSAICFLISLITAIYKSKCNTDFLLEFGTNEGSEKEIRLKEKIKWLAPVMIFSYLFGIIFATLFLIFIFFNNGN